MGQVEVEVAARRGGAGEGSVGGGRRVACSPTRAWRARKLASVHASARGQHGEKRACACRCGGCSTVPSLRRLECARPTHGRRTAAVSACILRITHTSHLRQRHETVPPLVSTLADTSTPARVNRISSPRCTHTYTHHAPVLHVDRRPLVLAEDVPKAQLRRLEHACAGGECDVGSAEIAGRPCTHAHTEGTRPRPLALSAH